MKKKILLTPELAEKFLAKNYPHNRKIIQNTVSRYVADIQEGRWNEDVSQYDQPIAISPDGFLLNGQHRCTAVIQAKKAVHVWVETNVPTSLFVYMDGGKTRSPKDFVEVPNATNIAAFARIVCAIEDGSSTLNQATSGIMKYMGSRGKSYIAVTRTQILEKIHEENDYLQELYSYASRAAKYFGNKKGAFANAFFVIDYVERGELLQEFVEDCSKIVPESEVVTTLRTYMTSKLMQKNFKASTLWVMGCVFTAYDHFVDDTPVEHFNKVEIYFNKYAALVNKERNKKKGGKS